MMMGMMIGLKLGFNHIHPNQDSDLNLKCIEHEGIETAGKVSEWQ